MGRRKPLGFLDEHLTDVEVYPFVPAFDADSDLRVLDYIPFDEELNLGQF